jgi:hypothetical protein
MALVDDDKLRKMLEGPAGLCSVTTEDVYGVCSKAAAILIEINKWDGKSSAVFQHGYVHEKTLRLFRYVDSNNPFTDKALEELHLVREK